MIKEGTTSALLDKTEIGLESRLYCRKGADDSKATFASRENQTRNGQKNGLDQKVRIEKRTNCHCKGRKRKSAKRSHFKRVEANTQGDSWGSEVHRGGSADSFQ